jgi:hypothetical protein
MTDDILGISGLWNSQSYSKIFEDLASANNRYADNNESTEITTKAIEESYSDLKLAVDFFISGLKELADNPHLQTPQANSNIVNAALLGAVPDDGIDDTAALQAAFNRSDSTILLASGTYQISRPINILATTHDVIIYAYGASIDASRSTLSGADGIVIYGSETSAAHNIIIAGLDVKNSNDLAFSSYGQGSRHNPYNLAFIETSTQNAASVGILMNSAENVLVYGHKDTGSKRGIVFMSPGADSGTFLPLDKPYDVSNIAVINSHVTGTQEYAYQFYFGRDILFANNYADGSSIISGEIAGVVFDRSENILVLNNTIEKASVSQILLNGTVNSLVAENHVIGGEFGIQTFYNWENDENPGIFQAENSFVYRNVAEGFSKSGVIFHGVHTGLILENALFGLSLVSIDVRSSFRPEDMYYMDSKSISVIGNSVVNGGISDTRPSAGENINNGLNVFISYSGNIYRNNTTASSLESGSGDGDLPAVPTPQPDENSSDDGNPDVSLPAPGSDGVPALPTPSEPKPDEPTQEVPESPPPGPTVPLPITPENGPPDSPENPLPLPATPPNPGQSEAEPDSGVRPEVLTPGLALHGFAYGTNGNVSTWRTIGELHSATKAADGYTNISLRSGELFTVGGAKKIIFIDGVIELEGTSYGAQLQGLYVGLLGRQGDSEGLSYWASQVSAGLTLQQVAKAFSVSSEFLQYKAQMNTADFISSFYNNILGRAQDQEGFSWYINQANNGISIQEIALSFAQSAEYVSYFAKNNNPGVFIRDVAASAVVDAYFALQGRLPDLEEISYWKAKMEDETISKAEIFGIISKNSEYWRVADSLTNEDFIIMLYEHLLKRSFDQEGMLWWKKVLESGETSKIDAALSFLESSEYRVINAGQYY